MTPPLLLRRLGRRPYPATLELQRALAAARADGGAPDTLLLVEHDPVITLGRRRTCEENVLTPGDTPVIRVERGGDVTWHGPGQLVGYPIIALGEGERDVHAVLRRLEEALIRTLAALGLAAERREGYTGVWCQGLKLVSVGVAVHRWVTFHGFALNVNPDLAEFARINPCGLEAGTMGSVEGLGGAILAWRELEDLVAAQIAAAFGRHLIEASGV